MPFSPISDAWTYLLASPALQLFVASALVLCAAIAWKVRRDVVLLRDWDSIRLNVIEIAHPHMPSAKAIAGIFFCCVTLLIASLQTVNGAPPFDSTFAWVFLASIFLVGGALGILAEMRWKRASECAFAIVVGTALSFLFLCWRFNVREGRILFATETMLLLVFCIALAWMMLFRSWKSQANALALLTVCFWLALYTAR